MKDPQEIWTMMILSAFAKRQNMSLAAATRFLLQNRGVAYLADCYGTLHQLSNDDVVDELIEMTNDGGTQ
jgi:hypothetical protein